MNHNNKISAMIDDYGMVYSDNSSIGNCFIEFYIRLWASRNTLPNLVEALPNDLWPLIDNDRALLVRPIIVGEIFYTLKSMPKGKSLGLMFLM